MATLMRWMLVCVPHGIGGALQSIPLRTLMLMLDYKKQYRTRNVRVGTVRKSKAAMTSR